MYQFSLTYFKKLFGIAIDSSPASTELPVRI
jgi:hypothetical protein